MTNAYATALPTPRPQHAMLHPLGTSSKQFERGANRVRRCSCGAPLAGSGQRQAPFRPCIPPHCKTNPVGCPFRAHEHAYTRAAAAVPCRHSTLPPLPRGTAVGSATFARLAALMRDGTPVGRTICWPHHHSAASAKLRWGGPQVQPGDHGQIASCARHQSPKSMDTANCPQRRSQAVQMGGCGPQPGTWRPRGN